LALASRHPLAAAVARAANAKEPLCAVEELGQGVRGKVNGLEVRLGGPSFCRAAHEAERIMRANPEASALAFRHGADVQVFAVCQQLRHDGVQVVADLRKGFGTEIVSGDR
jgi:P-type Cu2+ transporter